MCHIFEPTPKKAKTSKKGLAILRNCDIIKKLLCRREKLEELK